MIKKLKNRWGVTSNIQLLLIFIVFSINGSFAAYIAKPLMNFIGLHKDSTSAWFFWPIRIILVFLVYQFTLPIVGFVFGQFKFFWKFTKKILSRLGLGFLLP